MADHQPGRADDVFCCSLGSLSNEPAAGRRPIWWLPPFLPLLWGGETRDERATDDFRRWSMSNADILSVVMMNSVATFVMIVLGQPTPPGRCRCQRCSTQRHQPPLSRGTAAIDLANLYLSRTDDLIALYPVAGIDHCSARADATVVMARTTRSRAPAAAGSGGYGRRGGS